MLAGKLEERLVFLGVNHRALLKPANLILLSLHLQKSTAVFQNFEFLPVHHLPHAV